MKSVAVLFIALAVVTALRLPPTAVSSDAAAEEELTESQAVDWAADDHAHENAAFEHVIDADLQSDEAEDEDTAEAEAESEDADADESDSESEDESEAEAEDDLALMEVEAEFSPFQAVANVAPFNMAVDPGHNFMNPFIRGYNPAYDGYTPQPGGQLWNNPSGPNWSPFGWSAPASYWSVYPPQYASHYVNPGMYRAPGMHQFLGPNYYGGHYGHAHGPLAAFPYGSQDPHVYGPHLDWPFGALTSDMDHVPGMGTGVNVKAAFPQFRQVFNSDESESDDAASDTTDSTSEEVDAADPAFVESAAAAATTTEMPAESAAIDAVNDAASANDESSLVSDAEYAVDRTNRVIPLRQQCVNCAYSN